VDKSVKKIITTHLKREGVPDIPSIPLMSTQAIVDSRAMESLAQLLPEKATGN
jgi:hypothetical protein